MTTPRERTELEIQNAVELISQDVSPQTLNREYVAKLIRVVVDTAISSALAERVQYCAKCRELEGKRATC